MEFLTKKSIEEFTEELSSKAAVPGGGGAAALVGALGAALGGMVASLTLGKPKYAVVEEEMAVLKDGAYRLQNELLALVGKDAEVFAPLAEAYGMPAGTDGEKAEKERVMQACLKQASLAPLEMMEKCGETLLLLEQFAAKGSALAVSDAGCGAALSKAAMQAAWLNVRINARLIKDEGFAAEIDARGRGAMEKGLPIADRIYADVEARLE